MMLIEAINEMLFDEEINRKFKEELECVRKIISNRINPPKGINVITSGPE